MRSRSHESVALTALAVEARRRGTTYGQLVANTTAQEQEEIIRQYGEHTGRPFKRTGEKKKKPAHGACGGGA